MRLRSLTTALLATGAVGALAPAASAADLLVAAPEGDRDTLYAFSSENPRQARELAITNPPAAPITGLDFRPAGGQVWLTARDGSLSTVALDLASGSATLTPQGAISVPLAGSSFGSDFNPVPNALRTVSDAEQNLRTTATYTTFADGPLKYEDGRPADVVAAAYTNPDTDPATGTTLYDVDAAQDLLAIQNPPNAGTLVPVGPLGLDVAPAGGFDITPGGTAFAALLPVKQAKHGSRLFTVDLATGAVEKGAKIGKDGAVIGSLAYAGPGA